MRSTFMGLEASRKGLFVQQSALYTTGHNISNANTEGYTRQRVNMQATPGFPYPGLNSPQYPGHLGTGVEVSTIQRMRDEFTDRQFRQETGKLGYWDSTLKSINQMEDILSEPSEFGINQAFTELWKSFQDLADNPTDSAARKVVVARAESLAESFNYNYTQLEMVQGNLGNEIAVSTNQINTILEKIAAINEQVRALEPNGYVTNDLYDARDLLMDKLNEYIPVTFDRVPSGGLATEVAEGSLRIYYQGVVIVDGKYAGNLSVQDTENKQIDGAIDTNNKFSLFNQIVITGAPVPNPPQLPNNAVYTGGTVDYQTLEGSHINRGKLLALIDAYGHETPDRNGSKGLYLDMLNELDRVASTFVEVFNAAHRLGFTLSDGQTPSTNGGDFFVANPAEPISKNIVVNPDIIKTPNLIAASSRVGEEGNTRWALELSNLQFKNISSELKLGSGILLAGEQTINIPNNGLDGFTFQNYYTGLIGDLGVLGDKAITNQFNSQTQMITVSNARSSMNSVSLDEEMTNMITFQQAYNANARMITVVDETLERIINGMGRVGL